MNVKRSLIGLVAAIAFVVAGGCVVNTASAADDTNSTSTKNVLMALEFMQDLNELGGGDVLLDSGVLVL